MIVKTYNPIIFEMLQRIAFRHGYVWVSSQDGQLRYIEEQTKPINQILEFTLHQDRKVIQRGNEQKSSTIDELLGFLNESLLPKDFRD